MTAGQGKRDFVEKRIEQRIETQLDGQYGVGRAEAKERKTHKFHKIPIEEEMDSKNTG